MVWITASLPGARNHGLTRVGESVMDDMKLMGLPIGIGIIVGIVVGAVIGGSFAIGIGIVIGMLCWSAICAALRAVSMPQS